MPEIDEQLFREKKRDELQKMGVQTYPAASNRTARCRDALAHFDTWLAENKEITLAGRVKSVRLHGGSVFLDLHDGSDRMQVFLRKDHVGEESFDLVKNYLDIGDFLQVTGNLFVTKKEEKTLEGSSITFLAKALLPLPEKWHGLSDIEARYRQRYLDLIANEGVKDIFVKRSAIVKTVRDFFEEKGFLEVETPMLQPLAGGATARPFVTHHNALNTDLFLRIAPELYLKRLIIGGFEKVFEFARCFRNEGIDHTHNPEFTQVEAYMAYADYTHLMVMMEELFVRLVQTLHLGDSFDYKGTQISVKAPFARITFRDAIKQYGKIDIDESDTETLLKEARKAKIDVATNSSRAKIMDELFKTFVVPHLQNPTFVIDYPVELSPLSKKKHDNPAYTERFYLVVAGIELVNAFSELNDPQDQLERFLEQAKQKTKGDLEAHEVDYDYITALQHGMPPTAGLGIGIDRLVALLTNSHSLKEVILFPTLRPKLQ